MILVIGLTSCVNIKLDQSYYDIMAMDHEAAIISQKNELKKLEEKKALINRKKKIDEALTNMNDRWLKVFGLMSSYRIVGRYEEVIPLYQRYMKKYPGDSVIAREYHTWYVRKYGNAWTGPGTRTPPVTPAAP